MIVLGCYGYHIDPDEEKIELYINYRRELLLITGMGPTDQQTAEADRVVYKKYPQYRQFINNGKGII